MEGILARRAPGLKPAKDVALFMGIFTQVVLQSVICIPALPALSGAAPSHRRSTPL